MDEKCLYEIKDYVYQVNCICKKLLNGINRIYDESLYSKLDFFVYRESVRKMEFRIEGICYRLHGRGCTAFGKGMYLDWEFGYRGRWCGISPWKVVQTLKLNKGILLEEENILDTCDAAVSCGLMYKKNDLYYFVISDIDKYNPNFPNDFDTLVIERRGQTCAIKKINKSNVLFEKVL